MKTYNAVLLRDLPKFKAGDKVILTVYDDGYMQVEELENIHETVSRKRNKAKVTDKDIFWRGLPHNKLELFEELSGYEIEVVVGH
jgi:hypothetical protein